MFAPWKLANPTDQGFGVIVCLDSFFPEPAENIYYCLTSSPPLTPQCPSHSNHEHMGLFPSGLLLPGTEHSCPSWQMLLLSCLDPLTLSPSVHTGFQPPAARTNLSQGSTLATVCCQCRRPECQKLRPSPTIP